jgi:hypothetical protein
MLSANGKSDGFHGHLPSEQLELQTQKQNLGRTIRTLSVMSMQDFYDDETQLETCNRKMKEIPRGQYTGKKKQQQTKVAGELAQREFPPFNPARFFFFFFFFFFF